ncbi:flagellar biosynthesis protein FlhA [Solimicrobium silvestre]|uniref:Flagellar biosynthesis protein FlhA n=1 Tax=Solimicrobium silvestre TaxID=2099400 RepID=A0A2S9H1N7_9BURK|nr:flagellar biosynthesis protein FlhA [Solimicrobium silvestre]PRC93901.1 FlhA: flagellar biosynthesis protein FlhA [Solimicrobium silvestre]
MNALRKILGANTDIFMVLLIVGVLLVLFTPIPPALLDLLILANFSFALLILLLTFYMAKPVEFSTFPSMLLIATLFRLSLNVAATRLILRDADAGHVIGAIGSYVVGGNYVIGLIVFFILIVVQYVVVTSGAQRVSEVAARFTLDSMPGQQMSIDADLNMGFIDQQEAQRRRKNISKEAAFYGAMDGASKFVKGDAIAGIIIMMINIIGGLIIGVMQLGMGWTQALQSYTLLTIGDGIVTQVPALIISVGTGLIVTRSASDDNLSLAAFRQMTSHPRTILLVALALFGLTALPGIPAIPAMVLVGAYLLVFVLKRGAKAAKENIEQESTDADVVEQDTYSMLNIEPIEVTFGTNLVPLLEGDEALFMERIASFRKQYALESGLILPSIRFRNGAKLGPNEYEIMIFGVNVARGELLLDHTLAIHSGGDQKKLRGTETKEPTYGLPAVWIDAAEREVARAAKFTLVDPPTVFMTHLSEVLRRQSANLLTRKELERLLGRVRTQQPGLVEEIIPTSLSISDVQRVLQNLLKEKVSIRNLDAIVETLADRVRTSKDPMQLTEMVRQRLASVICQSLVGNNAYLQVMTLDPIIEQRLLQGIRDIESGGAFAIEPKFAEQFVARLAQQADKMMKSNAIPVLICAPDLRRHIRTLSERMAPHLRVLSLAEIPTNIELRAFGAVTL